jgi:hypothetical protein
MLHKLQLVEKEESLSKGLRGQSGAAPVSLLQLVRYVLDSRFRTVDSYLMVELKVVLEGRYEHVVLIAIPNLSVSDRRSGLAEFDRRFKAIETVAFVLQWF